MFGVYCRSLYRCLVDVGGVLDFWCLGVKYFWGGMLDGGYLVGEGPVWSIGLVLALVLIQHMHTVGRVPLVPE